MLKLILQPTEVIPVYEVKAQPARTEVGEEEVGVEVQESLPLPSFIGKYFIIALLHSEINSIGQQVADVIMNNENSEWTKSALFRLEFLALRMIASKTMKLIKAYD